jgi:pimeloyl-ACP methyl ester carboxylesterase
MAVPADSHREERLIEAQPGIRLWADATGDPDAAPLLLVMGANGTGIAWPEALVTRLAERHRVIRYDHRDTGRSTRAFAERPARWPAIRRCRAKMSFRARARTCSPCGSS